MISLAGKYRPKNLSEIIGQDKAVAALRGFLRAGRFNQGVLLAGLTGTGKTSAARILAHTVNCEEPKDGNPCLKCSYCRQVEQGHYPEVLELNFSDTRGIDTIRELQETLSFEPQAKFKVVILDEMHNMTSQAANALLKPLEEPLPHVMFILATTEPQKVLPTIRGRCFPVVFTRVSDDAMLKHVASIAEAEKIKLPDYALKYVVMSAKGSVRQALASLDTLILAAQSNPDLDMSRHDNLSRLLYIAEESVATYCNFLLGGVYAGRFSKALGYLYEIARQPQTNLKLFFENVYNYHMQTLHLMVDPKRNAAVLYDDYYEDWYKSVYEAVQTPVGKRGGLFKLTVPAAIEIVELLSELCEKLKNYDADFHRLATAFTVKATKIVLSHEAQAYTQQSVFHRLYAAQLCAGSGE